MSEMDGMRTRKIKGGWKSRWMECSRGKERDGSREGSCYLVSIRIIFSVYYTRPKKDYWGVLIMFKCVELNVSSFKLILLPPLSK